MSNDTERYYCRIQKNMSVNLSDGCVGLFQDDKRLCRELPEDVAWDDDGILSIGKHCLLLPEEDAAVFREEIVKELGRFYFTVADRQYVVDFREGAILSSHEVHPFSKVHARGKYVSFGDVLLGEVPERIAQRICEAQTPTIVLPRLDRCTGHALFLYDNATFMRMEFGCDDKTQLAKHTYGTIHDSDFLAEYRKKLFTEHASELDAWVDKFQHAKVLRGITLHKGHAIFHCNNARVPYDYKDLQWDLDASQTIFLKTSQGLVSEYQTSDDFLTFLRWMRDCKQKIDHDGVYYYFEGVCDGRRYLKYSSQDGVVQLKTGGDILAHCSLRELCLYPNPSRVEINHCKIYLLREDFARLEDASSDQQRTVESKTKSITFESSITPGGIFLYLDLESKYAWIMDYCGTRISTRVPFTKLLMFNGQVWCGNIPIVLSSKDYESIRYWTSEYTHMFAGSIREESRNIRFFVDIKDGTARLFFNDSKVFTEKYPLSELRFIEDNDSVVFPDSSLNIELSKTDLAELRALSNAKNNHITFADVVGTFNRVLHVNKAENTC